MRLVMISMMDPQLAHHTCARYICRSKISRCLQRALEFHGKTQKREIKLARRETLSQKLLASELMR